MLGRAEYLTACPTCRAPKGYPCYNLFAIAKKQPHVKRIRKAVCMMQHPAFNGKAFVPPF